MEEFVAAKIVPGRVPMNAAESTAVDKLTAGVVHCSVTRRDADEQGPLLVTVEGVEYVVDARGRKRKRT